MKKLVLLCLLFSCFVFTANAGVTFLPNASGSVGSSRKNTDLSTDQKCKNAGYKQHGCETSKKGVDACPYNKSYFKTCCAKEYKYTVQECLKAGLRYSSSSCGGLYKCI